MSEKTLFNGFECEIFDFEDTVGYIVFPKTAPNRKMAFKTEYWNAFPELEIELLKRGYHLVHVKNHTRLANRDDCDRKSRFIEYVSKTYDLDCRCILDISGVIFP